MIPCFNTHIYINTLINLLRKKTSLDILVYDDGSSPKLHLNKEYKNVKFLRNNKNKGKGYTLHKGFMYAKKNNYSHVITMDGDMQHSPDDIIDFISEGSRIDFLFGSRRLSQPMPIHRILSNKITSFIISVLKNFTINDSQCGFRRYKVSSLNLSTIVNHGYLYETELILNSLNSNMTIKNVNIKTVYEDSPSNINNIKDTLSFIKLIFRYIFV